MRGWKSFSALKIFTIVLVIGALAVFILTGRALALVQMLSSKFSVHSSSSSLLVDLSAIDLRIQRAGPNEWVLLSKELDNLEKKTIGVESELSILKRRRSLARSSLSPQDTRVQLDYLEGAKRALERFPHAEVLSAVVAEATASSGQRAKAVFYAQSLSEERFLPIAAAICLSESPVKEETLLTASLIYQKAGKRAEAAFLRLDSILIRLLSQDILGTLSYLRSFEEKNQDIDDRERELHAELEYDFGDKKAAADLFTFMEGSLFTFRRADALYLSSEIMKAREAWKSVAVDEQAGELRAKALYNLASTDLSAAEARSHLQRSLDVDPNDVFSLLRLSRLLDSEKPEGSALQHKLLKKALTGPDPALVELEFLKNRLGLSEEEKNIADIWLLLENYPQDERLLSWAANYFEHTQKFQELDRLLERESRRGTVSKITQYQALALLRQGKVDEAEELFLSLANADGDWYIAANLGLISESKREPVLALQRYETASSLLHNKMIRAELQLRIARCLEVLGQNTEARRALAYGVDLDPSNRMLRLALRKLGGF